MNLSTTSDLAAALVGVQDRLHLSARTNTLQILGLLTQQLTQWHLYNRLAKALTASLQVSCPQNSFQYLVFSL